MPSTDRADRRQHDEMEAGAGDGAMEADLVGQAADIAPGFRRLAQWGYAPRPGIATVRLHRRGAGPSFQ